MNNLESCFIIAELSANHDGSTARAKKIIDAAAQSGADAIKVQTYTADTLTIDCSNEFFTLDGGLWSGRTLYDLYQEASLPWEWTEELMHYTQEQGLAFFSTPFDVTAVDFLERLSVRLYKIASFEIVDIPLLEKVGATRKPVIMSTGMASISEIEEAVSTLREAGTNDITLLKCTSAYPALPSEADLLTIPDMVERFGCRAGLSDHTLGSVVAVAAVALGASVIEKHFTLDRSGGGPDDSFSMEPAEFAQMVTDIRVAEQAMGEVNYSLSDGEQDSIRFRKSLFVVEDIAKGEEFTSRNVRCIRPGYGIHPRYLGDVIGKSSRKNLKRGTPLQLNHFS